MDFIKNSVLVLCLFFLFGCLQFGESKIGLKKFDLKKVTFDQNTYPVAILGGGGGGLTAAIYLSQANIPHILVEGEKPGGAIAMSHSVRNWPGEIDISGSNIAEKLKKHALNYGANILPQTVLDIDFSLWPYLITVKNLIDGKIKQIKALSCIIAMGATPNYLNIPGEKEYWGRGVSNCAVCDGTLYKDKIVAIIGGGDAAINEANYLSKIAKKVMIFVRREKLRTKGRVVKEVIERSNVEVITNTIVKKIRGDNKKINDIVTYNQNKKEENVVNIDGLFLAIGSTPNSKIFQEELDLDSNGYVIVNKDQETSRMGIFSVGDISDQIYRQLITSAGDGCKAALQVQKFLEHIGYEPEKSVEKIVEKEKVKFVVKIVDIESEREFKKILEENEKVFVDFFAPWCIPCQQMMPVVERLGKYFSDKVVFVKVDVSKLGVLARDYGVYNVPTFIFFKDGKKVEIIIGGRSFEDLKNIILRTFKIGIL